MKKTITLTRDINGNIVTDDNIKLGTDMRYVNFKPVNILSYISQNNCPLSDLLDAIKNYVNLSKKAVCGYTLKVLNNEFNPVNELLALTNKHSQLHAFEVCEWAVLLGVTESDMVQLTHSKLHIKMSLQYFINEFALALKVSNDVFCHRYGTWINAQTWDYEIFGDAMLSSMDFKNLFLDHGLKDSEAQRTLVAETQRMIETYGHAEEYLPYLWDYHHVYHEYGWISLPEHSDPHINAQFMVLGCMDYNEKYRDLIEYYQALKDIGISYHNIKEKNDFFEIPLFH